ncbi:MAG: sodium:solute symporter family transporter, partial [Planctomyces sp.]
MTVADGIVLAVFVLLLPLMAARVGRSLQREEEYFTGGQRTNLFQLVFFMFGSGTATDSTSTVMSGVWRAGIAGVWWQLVWVLVTPVFWVLAPMLRRLRAITTAEFFSIRFGTSTSVLYSLYGMAICVVLMAGVLYGSSRLLNTLTDPLFDNVADRLQLQFPVLSPQTAFLGPGYGQQPLLFFRPLKGDALAGIFLSILLAVPALLLAQTPEAKLDALGITLHAAPSPAANYVNAVHSGNLLFLAGKGPTSADGTNITGKVGKDLTTA